MTIEQFLKNHPGCVLTFHTDPKAWRPDRVCSLVVHSTAKEWLDRDDFSGFRAKAATLELALEEVHQDMVYSAARVGTNG